jgi:hypothetical protein
MQEIISKYILAWNTLTISGMEEIFDDNVEYHSQVVLNVLKGKPAVLNYMNGKFNVLADGTQPAKTYLAMYGDEYCAAMMQLAATAEANPFTNSIRKLPFRFAVLMFKFKDDKICQICFCIIPGMSDIKFV